MQFIELAEFQESPHSSILAVLMSPQALLCEIEASTAGNRSEADRERQRHQDLHQPPERQDAGQHRGVLHRTVCRGGQEVRHH